MADEQQTPNMTEHARRREEQQQRRLATALRENLARRKEQGRARAQAAEVEGS